MDGTLSRGEQEGREWEEEETEKHHISFLPFLRKLEMTGEIDERTERETLCEHKS